MNGRAWAANQLAARLLAGPWTRASILECIRAAYGAVHHPTRAALAVRVAALGAAGYPPSPQTLVAHLYASEFFRPLPASLVPSALDPPRFAPAPAFDGLPIPALATPGELAAWLALPPEQLDWLSDERRVHRRATQPVFQHYRYTVITKARGGTRLLEAPKPRLKAIQRRILHEILDAAPLHPRAHGFAPGRSCLTGAQVHAGEAVVLTLDLQGFFPSIGLPRVNGLFRRLGYPWAVARRLAGLCTTTTPASILLRHLGPADPHDGRDLYRLPHLPQGAPTSPALANLAAWTLDLRLHGLARALDANYTRYADDLAFSGDLRSATQLDRFQKTAAAIVQDEGFRLNPEKTRVMPRSTQQRVTGIVVNAHCNPDRAAFDALKALLHNCTRTGPAAQNREGLPDFHRNLQGRVAWVEHLNPARGAKLRRLFDGIRWEGAVPPMPA